MILKRLRLLASLSLFFIGAALCEVALADEHRGHRDHDIYRSPHWVFDDRHHHGHYYPAIGYVVPTLPLAPQFPIRVMR